MSKILELALETLAMKIDKLESEVKALKENKSASQNLPKKYPYQEASQQQLKFLKDLGVNLEGDISKFEAQKLIKEILASQNKTPKQETYKQSVESKGLLSTKDEVSTTESVDGESPVKENNSKVFDEDGAYI